MSLSSLKRIFCFWIMGKVIDILICLYLILSSKFKEQQIQDYMKGDSFVGLLLYVVYIVDLMVTEVWPGRMVLERSFLKVFTKKKIGSGDNSRGSAEGEHSSHGFYVVPAESSDSSIIQQDGLRVRSGSVGEGYLVPQAESSQNHVAKSTEAVRRTQILQS